MMSGSSLQQYKIGRRWIVGGLGQVVKSSLFAYGSYRLISWAWNEWNNSSSTTNHDEDFYGVIDNTPIRRRRKKRMQQQQQRQVVGAFVDFLPQLRLIISNPYTNLTKVKQSLKRIRHANAAQARVNCSGDDKGSDEKKESKEEMELWEEMKLKVLLGMLGTAYCQVLLYLLLQIQCHLLLSQPSKHENDIEDEFKNSVRHKVLSRSMSHFFEKSVPQILLYIRSILEQNTTHWNVMKGTELSLSEMHHTLQSVQQKIDLTSTNRQDQNSISLISCMIPIEDNVAVMDQCVVEERAQYILNLTWDMIESPMFAHAFHDSISSTMELLYRFGYSPIFQKNVDSNDINDHQVEELLPLVNILTQIKKTTMPTFYDNNISGNDERAMEMKNEWTIISSMLDVDAQQQNQQNNPPNIYIAELENIQSVLELSDACMIE